MMGQEGVRCEMGVTCLLSLGDSQQNTFVTKRCERLLPITFFTFDDMRVEDNKDVLQ